MGFTGKYLAAALHAAGYVVFGLSHKPEKIIPNSIKKVYVGDLADAASLSKVIDEVQPDIVIHLAAIAFVAHGDVEAIYSTNIIGSRNLLQALSIAKKMPKSVLMASSANIYGNNVSGMLDESVSPAPANDYAVSKLSMEYVARLYKDKLPIIIARPFNYTGVGQSENFLIPKIVSHIRRKAPIIELGNLDVARDFSDVRTVVQYYKGLVEQPAAIGGCFNICSGKAYTLEEVLKIVNSIAQYDIEVVVNPSFVRAQEVKILIGSPVKLRNTIDSIQDISLTETLNWMIK